MTSDENFNLDEEGHVLDTVLDDFAHGLESTEVRRHVDNCPFCGIRYHQLTTSEGPRADIDAIARALPAPPSVPKAVVEVLNGAIDAVAKPQDVWLTVGPTVSMVWIRRVIETTALVQPVVFDIEMADQYTLVLPAGANPFGVPVAVICSFDAQIDLDKLDRRLFELSVKPSVEALRAARRSKTTTPPDIMVGPPVDKAEDERHEFRQIIADRITALATPDEGSDAAEFEGKIEDLRARRPHCRLLPCDEVVAGKASASDWRALVTVREIGSAVVVLLGSLDSGSAAAAREIVELASATAVAFIEDLDGCEARVYEPGELAELRYAAPSGDRLDVDTHVASLDVVDALFKYLDATAFFEDDIDVRTDDGEVSDDIAEIALSEAQEAVSSARARRYQRLKGEAFKALNDDDARFIASMVQAGAAGKAVVEMLHKHSRGR